MPNEPNSGPRPRSPNEPTDPFGQACRAFKLAVATLTVIPVRFRDGETTDADLARSRWAYPIVGALMGLGLGGLSYGLAGKMPGVSTFLLVATWVVITGGIHLDGLADTADGLFLDGDADRRLTVMRDPRVGTFGIVAVVLTILGKYACLTSLAIPTRSWAIFGAVAVGRSLILVSAGSVQYARREGTGRIVVEATTQRDAIWATVFVAAVALFAVGGAGIAASITVIGWVVLLTRLASTRLGGVTGDVLGAAVELGELFFLLPVALVR